jgi:Na+-driven multidrug efflux pump
MGKPVETTSVRVLLMQMLAHALIFAAPSAGNFAERALLASDTAATAALGLSWTAFSLLYTFTTNVVSVCPLLVGRCSGNRDDPSARAVAGQALLLAGGGGAIGLAVAVAAGAAAAFTAGPPRGAALFLATQGLALGPLLAAKALTGYFAGRMRVGPRLLAAVSVAPVAVHVAFAWLLTGLLSWSVAGAGLARLGAAVAAVAAALAIARAEFGGLVGPLRRVDRALLRAMLIQGSLLGLQQVVAGLMVLFLYLMAARAGERTLAALTLTHSGVYPLLFCFAWGSSQAVAPAAAKAVGRGDGRELARVTWLCLGLSAVLAFALPWGAFAVCGRPTLAWLVGGSPAGGAVLTASVQFMGLLAVFFVFDFAINFLSALLNAANEQAYLLMSTAAAAAGFGLLLLVLPPGPDGACLMGAFITAQAVWAVLLLIRVAGRLPRAAGRSDLGAPALGVRGSATRSAPAGTGAAGPRLTTAPCPRYQEERPMPGKGQEIERWKSRARPTTCRSERQRRWWPEPVCRTDNRADESHTGGTCDGNPAAKHRSAVPRPASPRPKPLD